MFNLCDSPIDEALLRRELEDTAAGALVVFEGRVRRQNQGLEVTSLEYQVYAELALKEGEKILREARERFNLRAVSCTHRHGHLALGDTAVWIGATAVHRDDAFRAARFVIDEVKKRLPIWKKEHYLGKAPTWVFCRDHAHHVHFEETDYYRKQARLTDQQKLKAARILVVGAGGLGCPVLMNLATAGVGHITVIDPDKIEISNVHRQPLYSPGLVGEHKAVVAATRLRELNPFIEVRALSQRVDASNALGLIEGHELVLDCTDNLRTKFLLHDACLRLGIPLVAASIYQFEGTLRTFVPQGGHGCLWCTHAELPDESKLGNCNDFGVLGAAVMALGSLQASEALQWIQHQRNSSVEDTVLFDLRRLSVMKLRNHARLGCESCAGTRPLPADDIDIDATRARELGAIFLDLRERGDEVTREFLETTGPVVLCCHRGVRSRRLAEELRAQGHRNFYSLAGGACSL